LPRKNTYKLALLVGAILLVCGLNSCSTKKNSFSRRAYHNLTTHYNGYWNGNESLKEGIATLSKEVKDDYNNILPVINYGTKENAQVVYTQMDRAIQKASIMIQRHSMKFGGKEYNKWIDDSYILIGKSYFFKQEYISARRTFNFVISEYFENEATVNEAKLWLARTYNQMGQFEKSEGLLNEVLNSVEKRTVNRRTLRDVHLVFSDFYIHQGKAPMAEIHLYDGLSLNSKKDLLTRIKFILAQIYQEKGDRAKATDLYTEVIKRNPPYQMAFQAKLNLALSFGGSASQLRMIEKKLMKMVKDIKNSEFRDQIYFALSELAFQNGNDTLGIFYLRASVATSISNNYQKSVSSLKLGELYFTGADYTNAQAYYDTAMQVLPSNFPDFEKIKRQSVILTSLMGNLNAVYTEDSLQRLAALSEDERFKVIDKLIENYQKEEERKAEEQQRLATSSLPGQNQFMVESGGKWYFYNPTTLSQGFTEFNRKWGKRVLADLWRLSNKNIIQEAFETGGMVASADTLERDSLRVLSNNPRDRQYYIQHIPLTPEMKLLSDKKIMESLYNAGMIYLEGLKDAFKARETFSELLERYPDCEFRLQTLYNLYKICKEQNDLILADQYKTLLKNEFPDSDYAKVIEDPEYFAKLAGRRNEAQKLYADTYKAFKSEQYFLVINYADKALGMLSDSVLTPKFEFLRALAMGKIEVSDSLSVAMQHFIVKYPDHELRPMALDILKSLGIEYEAKIVQTKDADEEDAGSFESSYNFNPDAIQMFVIIVNQEKVNVNALKVRISDFNIKNYSLRKLRVNSIVLDASRQLITVGNFDGYEDVMDFFHLITGDDYVYGNLVPEDFVNLAVSTENYPLFYREKDVDLYSKFFKRFYLKKGQ